MATTALRPLSIGEILDGAFTFYRRKFLLLYGTQVLIFLPSILTGLASTAVASYVTIPLTFIAVTAPVWQYSELILGRTPDLAGSLRIGVRRFFPVLGALIVTTILIGFGLVLLIVPGILLAIMFFAVTPVVILEGNFNRSIQRSRDLARGSWQRILAVMLVYTMIATRPAAAFGIAAGVGEVFRAIQTGQRFEPTNPGFVQFTLQTLVQCLTTPFSAGTLTLLYYDQRVRKEALDVELAAAALDQLAPVPGAPATLTTGTESTAASHDERVSVENEAPPAANGGPVP